MGVAVVRTTRPAEELECCVRITDTQQGRNRGRRIGEAPVEPHEPLAHAGRTRGSSATQARQRRAHPLARDARLAALVHEQAARQGECLERPRGQRHRHRREQHGERVLGELRQHFALQKFRQQRANQSLASVECGIDQPRPTAGRGQQAFLPGAGVFDAHEEFRIDQRLDEPVGSRLQEERGGGGRGARGDQQPAVGSRHPFGHALELTLESRRRGIVEQAIAPLGQARAQMLEQPGLAAAGCRAEPDDGGAGTEQPLREPHGAAFECVGRTRESPSAGVDARDLRHRRARGRHDSCASASAGSRTRAR